MPPVEFEPTISAGERPQTYALDRAAAGTGKLCILGYQIPYLKLLRYTTLISEISYYADQKDEQPKPESHLSNLFHSRK